MERLTEQEIAAIRGSWMHLEGISYVDLAVHDNILMPHLSKLKDRRVIEIGPGNHPITDYFACKEYVAATGGIHDGLTVLRKEPNKSAAIVSFGVIDDAILLDHTANDATKILCKRYINELVREIRRVMTPFAIIVSQHAEKYLGRADIGAPQCGGVYLPR